MCPHCLTSTLGAIIGGIPGLMYAIRIIKNRLRPSK